MVVPATANERGPQVDNLTGGTISWLYSVMTGVDILMVSVLLENTVQRDILEPCS